LKQILSFLAIACHTTKLEQFISKMTDSNNVSDEYKPSSKRANET
jgi:hypothetical protein